MARRNSDKHHIDIEYYNLEKPEKKFLWYNFKEHKRLLSSHPESHTKEKIMKQLEKLSKQHKSHKFYIIKVKNVKN